MNERINVYDARQRSSFYLNRHPSYWAFLNSWRCHSIPMWDRNLIGWHDILHGYRIPYKIFTRDIYYNISSTYLISYIFSSALVIDSSFCRHITDQLLVSSLTALFKQIIVGCTNISFDHNTNKEAPCFSVHNANLISLLTPVLPLLTLRKCPTSV